MQPQNAFSFSQWILKDTTRCLTPVYPSSNNVYKSAKHASDSDEVWESQLGMSNLIILEGLLLLNPARPHLLVAEVNQF